MAAARARAGRRTQPAHSRRRRSVAHVNHEGGAERWMVTYADMLTLLLVLFIVLFSISVVNTSKFISLKTSLASAFGSGRTDVLSGGSGLNENAADGQGQQVIMPGIPMPSAPASSQPPNQPAVDTNTVPQDLTTEVENFKRIEAAIDASLRQRGLSGSVRFSIDRRGLVITVVTNDLVFPGNSAVLLSGGQRILSAVAPPLLDIANKIEVDGFTNQENVSTYPYPTGWELSSARASSVVRYLVSAGVGESRLSAVGFSDQRPLYPPSDPRSVTLNRRVEIVVLTTLSADTAALLPAAAGN